MLLPRIREWFLLLRVEVLLEAKNCRRAVVVHGVTRAASRLRHPRDVRLLPRKTGRSPPATRETHQAAGINCEKEQSTESTENCGLMRR